MGTPGKARTSISHPAESGHGSLMNPLIGVTARVRYLHAFRNSATQLEGDHIEGIRRPCSQQVRLDSKIHSYKAMHRPSTIFP